ncbi:hypothetical protein [Pseudomonas fragariae (ex Marin et al. 2024)]|uniref:Uncharacterized protein n=2 Tax=Pseudomonas fragariae (ex Marin et al. 2024) TaxID=3080056 RepID=A0ABT3LNF5_9PSED|nr:MULTISPECIES: hypothetical protein [unclassified Pseudomonas]MCW6057993.1 hypothetical protein [Pseudomonas fragi]MDV0428082.1 hypothetical protein [Pseudomonas sp. 17]MDX9574439.1 hypothetical protein [Pseudomonas sp. 21(2023)]MDX9588623.1 hypothetical protein [Pseudomonas sp. 19(2023)]MDX9625548.1 hypothetical protein [Pseudomonas sp. 20]
MSMKCSWSGKLGLNTSLFAVIACLCAGPLDAGQTDVDSLGMTLCAAEEDVYFSCPLPGNKIVSVCASNNKAPGSGYVQYRYGTPDNMELLYPNKKAPPVGKFFLVDASEGSVNKGIIKFKNGRYTYLLAQAFVSYLTVLKDGKLLLRKNCEEGGYAFISRKADQGMETVSKSAEDFK